LNYDPIPFRFSPIWNLSYGFNGLLELSWSKWVDGSPILVWETSIKRQHNIEKWLKKGKIECQHLIMEMEQQMATIQEKL